MRFFILTVLFSLHTYAEDIKCLSGTNLSPVVDNCLEQMIAVLAHKTEKSDTPETAMKAAELFLDKYKESVDFDTSTAIQLAERLKGHAESTKNPVKLRSQLWLLTSGVHGRLADKLRVNGGLEHGKHALNAIKSSLSLDKTYKSAAIAYATTINAFTEQNFIARKFIESNMDIKISNEVKAAIKALEEASLTNHELYQKLKKV